MVSDLAMANRRRSSPSSFLIRLNRDRTALHGPHHAEYTSITAVRRRIKFCLVFLLHTSQSILTNERTPDLLRFNLHLQERENLQYRDCVPSIPAVEFVSLVAWLLIQQRRRQNRYLVVVMAINVRVTGHVIMTSLSCQKSTSVKGACVCG